MDFNKKLQALRKQKNLTQEELAQRLFVSRTAVSKWESGKGYPNIDSLKQIATFFDTTVDELLSTDEILDLAQSESTKAQTHLRDLVSGLLDIATSTLLFLPLFAQNSGNVIKESSLLNLTAASPYLKITYLGLVCAVIFIGLLTLTLQSFEHPFWVKIKAPLSIILNLLCVVLFTLCRQPYPALLMLVFLAVKASLFFKKR